MNAQLRFASRAVQVVPAGPPAGETKLGASFWALTVRTKVSLVVSEPSLTVRVIVAVPLI